MHDLTDVEQRGRLTHIDGSFETHTMEGWFMLSYNRRSVTARKVYGRNRWVYCDVDAVIDFEVTA